MANHETSPRSYVTTLVATGFFVIVGFFLVTEHRAHLFGALPYLFLLACPLMHVFMHGHHGGDHGTHTDEPTAARPVDLAPERRRPS